MFSRCLRCTHLAILSVQEVQRSSKNLKESACCFFRRCAGMGESVKQALKEAERAAKKQKLCVDISASSISTTLRSLMAARAQVCLQTVRFAAR